MSKYTASRINRRPIFDKKLYGESWEQFKRDNPLTNKRCENCGARKKLQRHHVVSVRNGGTHSVSNIKILCENCHIDEHPHLQKRRKKP